MDDGGLLGADGLALARGVGISRQKEGCGCAGAWQRRRHTGAGSGWTPGSLFPTHRSGDVPPAGLLKTPTENREKVGSSRSAGATAGEAGAGSSAAAGG